MKKSVITSLFICFTLAVWAQDGALEEYFFQSGKIKVVIAVAVSIALGIFIYLFRLDKKITQLEKRDK